MRKMQYLFTSLALMTLLSCTRAPKDRTVPFEGIDNGRELGGLGAYLEKALGFSADEQERMKKRYLKR